MKMAEARAELDGPGYGPSRLSCLSRLCQQQRSDAGEAAALIVRMPLEILVDDGPGLVRPSELNIDLGPDSIDQACSCRKTRFSKQTKRRLLRRACLFDVIRRATPTGD